MDTHDDWYFFEYIDYISAVSADALAPPGAKASADTAMIKCGSCISMELFFVCFFR